MRCARFEGEAYFVREPEKAGADYVLSSTAAAAQKSAKRSLKMHDAISNFFRSPLVPVLRTDVAAGATRDVHRGLIAVAAVGALPLELAVLLDDLDLSVVAANLAEVALGVELRVPGERRWNSLSNLSLV